MEQIILRYQWALRHVQRARESCVLGIENAAWREVFNMADLIGLN